MKIVSKKYRPQECDKQGCDNPAVEWVLLRAGSAHLCAEHVREICRDGKNQTILTACSVCGETFQPSDDMDFVCLNCQLSLIGHCGCGSNDVRMDWGIEPDGEFQYYWIVECSCGRTLKSRLHSMNEQDKISRELHKRWCAMPAPTPPPAETSPKTAKMPVNR